jgi:predicted metal-dependent peptidase
MSNLRQSIDYALDNECRDLIVQSRTKMLLRQPFFGQLIMKLNIVNADRWCETVATDGENFYYNCNFVKSMFKEPMGLKRLDYMFGHIILHICFEHIHRGFDKNAEIWDLATDIVVNNTLNECKNMGSKPDFITRFDSSLETYSAEEIYDMLIKKNPPPPQNNQGQGQGQGKGQGNNQYDKQGSQTDEHLRRNPKEDPNAPNDPRYDGQEGDGRGDMTEGPNGTESHSRPYLMSEAERKQFQQQMRGRMAQAAQNAMRNPNRGDMPAGLARMIDEFADPVMPWNEILSVEISDLVSDEPTYARFDRKSDIYSCIVTPGFEEDEQIDVHVVMDMSGSIGQEEIEIFMGEVKSIMEGIPNWTLTAMCFDTEVYNVQTFTSANGDQEKILEYVPQGGGGTTVGSVFEYWKKNRIVPTQAVIFTDGYVESDWGGSPDYCPVFWLIKGNKQAQPLYGRFAYYEDYAHASKK